MKPALLLIATIALAACGWGGAEQNARTERAGSSAEPPARMASQPPGTLASDTSCSPATGDSARAVCLATRPHADSTGPTTAAALPRHVFEVVRRGETICVHTGPESPGAVVAVDGEERVSVVRGAVVARIQTDSTGCR